MCPLCVATPIVQDRHERARGIVWTAKVDIGLRNAQRRGVIVLHPIMLVPMTITAFAGRRWAIPLAAVGSALAIFPGEWLGYPLFLSSLGALTGLPLRWGIEELIDELTPIRRPRP